MTILASNPLPEQHVLGDYILGSLLSTGGFSMVYLAHDQQQVPRAIKEYFPCALAKREGETRVIPVSEETVPLFQHGLKCFFEEARALAAITHPNVVRVTDIFRANETVYMVMQYVRGRTLQFHIKRHRRQFTERFLRATVTNLLNGLREVHSRKLLHLDIKPENIYLAMDGRPVLLDLGAARYALGESPFRFHPMLSGGYAAPEQYRNGEQLGPWTDVYAVGAAMYSCVTGTRPISAEERVAGKELPPARDLAETQYSDEFFDIIDNCMQLDATTRPQSAFVLQKALLGRTEVSKVSESGPLDPPEAMPHLGHGAYSLAMA